MAEEPKIQLTLAEAAAVYVSIDLGSRTLATIGDVSTALLLRNQADWFSELVLAQLGDGDAL